MKIARFRMVRDAVSLSNEWQSIRASCWFIWVLINLIEENDSLMYFMKSLCMCWIFKVELNNCYQKLSSAVAVSVNLFVSSWVGIFLRRWAKNLCRRWRIQLYSDWRTEGGGRKTYSLFWRQHSIVVPGTNTSLGPKLYTKLPKSNQPVIMFKE